MVMKLQLIVKLINMGSLSGRFLLTKKEVLYLKDYLKKLTKFRVSSWEDLNVEFTSYLLKGLKGETDEEDLKLCLPTNVDGHISNAYVKNFKRTDFYVDNE